MTSSAEYFKTHQIEDDAYPDWDDMTPAEQRESDPDRFRDENSEPDPDDLRDRRIFDEGLS